MPCFIFFFFSLILFECVLISLPAGVSQLERSCLKLPTTNALLSENHAHAPELLAAQARGEGTRLSVSLNMLCFGAPSPSEHAATDHTQDAGPALGLNVVAVSVWPHVCRGWL